MQRTGLFLTLRGAAVPVPGGNPDETSELFVMNRGGTGLTRLTFSTGGGVLDAGMSSNGQRIVFASDSDLVPGQNRGLGD